MRLSVALCTLNGQDHLPAQLASIAEQSRRPDELIVCDDGSQDQTLEILRQFAGGALGSADSASRLIVPIAASASRRTATRIVVNDCTLGSTANFASAIAACTGDIIVLCDQDDVWHRDKLARFAAIFEAEPNVSLVASDLEVIGGEGRRVWQTLGFSARQQAAVEAGRGPRLWLRANTLTGAAMAFRASLRDILLPIPPGWVHDAWIAFIAGAVGSIRLIRDPLTRYRVHAQQQIGVERRGWRRLFRDAQNRSAEDFARTADCFEAAAARLEQFADRIRDPSLLARIRGKVEFARAQQRMREGPRAARIPSALRQLVRGRYHRFSRGWTAFVADLFL